MTDHLQPHGERRGSDIILELAAADYAKTGGLQIMTNPNGARVCRLPDRRNAMRQDRPIASRRPSRETISVLYDSSRWRPLRRHTREPKRAPSVARRVRVPAMLASFQVQAGDPHPSRPPCRSSSHHFAIAALAAAIFAFTASRLKLAPFCIGGNSTAVTASFSTWSWMNTKRQNSYLNQSKYCCAPYFVPLSGQPVRSNGSRRRLVKKGMSGLVLSPTQPPGWSMKRYL